MKVSIFKPQPAGAGGQAASRPKTGQSIRGKISGPIPIPTPTDDEFPMRNPGTGIATPLSAEDRERQLQTEAGHQTSAPFTQPEAVPTRNTDSVMAHSGSGSGSVTGSASGSGTGSAPTHQIPRGSPQSQRRTNPPSTLRHSVVSEATENTNNSKDKPQRKKSTLRGAFSKLFGRKKKTTSLSAPPERASTYNSPSQHRSDPSALAREPKKETDAKRAASLPITEYDRALRSHSVGPNDFSAIESARNSMHADATLSGRRRAATATGQLFGPRDGEIGGLSPRPASTHARGSRLFPMDEDPEEIGRAITSDVVGKRRSRSLSGIAGPQDDRADVRRRSDEIRYWRESYDPAFMSPTSSNAPDHDNDETGTPGAATQDAPPKTPLEPFNFGNMPHLNVMAGMKITAAASLETRIDTLEAKMRRAEKIITQLCNAAPGTRIQPDQFHRPPSSLPTPNRSTMTAVPGMQSSSSRHGSMCSRDSRASFLEGVRDNDSATQLTAPSVANRPTSDSTIRGAVSLPTISQGVSGPLTTEHYSTLLRLLEAERASRHSLEAQVRMLAQRLEAVAASTPKQRWASIHGEPPPTARSFGDVSAFDQQTPEYEYGNGHKNQPLMPEDSGIATRGLAGVDEDDYSETYATPREEQSHGYGAFGEELRDGDGDEDDEDGQRKKAARTLSLSQLTMGKPHPKAVI
ncbi:hypothetical protein HYQ45_010063 [Verticillium longisporum]|uniref:Uncharacterized protein n=3 Tax=Verticillium TaxID=1036719 RepID=G2X324_VERDV|nr:uncharacterized protein VDAG_04218 [Verticillium dahliae VdLs.17]KAG7123656.1 hypothetical protein HYQ44_002292 [Verticillium longisporum]KAH6700434.1 hypothetical protein EV126DRAFT_35188 [Verticillium dahliae]EGY22780.1 hypothetical protein VDAG_04218 [Verticillium dahliae VdLs.17]KAG7131371.1 hypothetical protein HYQ45_010063 [Verticillium longisporum]PNH34696.1 hypothetical protein BJF96_g2094 [Verticillium dahliae]